jgi:glycosyltransferase involved in cell wall biosynthesis
LSSTPLMSTTNLSIIILTHRDDDRLKQALASADFADEVITIKNQNISDFALARNQATKKATHDWVLFLDSDEKIDPKSINEIKKIIKHNKVDGVIINRQDIFYGKTLKHGEAGNTQLLRMGKKNKISWHRPVHEVATIDGRVKKTKIELLHQAHSNLNEFVLSITKYAAIEAKYRHQQKMSFSYFQLLFFPLGKFIYNYLFKLGFMDGWRGFIYAIMMSLHSFAVRVHQYEIKSQKS